ncbi:ribosomal protection-like ABC-F family protein [Dysgonomonas sp. ZJ709]|uniref:ribosomal protection-like ABC-F family protein n=1 Tax=Dysgonomonas sp. ZJ709 TaxID=2709797 RepID=UPI0013ED8932|nr:ABC-F family ATP-binding cassette domain-containing protein [Dysgonomonas sp. ZJ709]
MSIIVKHISYIHPDRETLFRDISFSISDNQKINLIGDNGSGKSTLLQIVAERLRASSGEIVLSEKPYYIPQHFGQYDHLTVAEALRINTKIEALHAIINGDASIENFTRLDEDWNIEERANKALSLWDLDHIALSQQISTLSGGEKTKVFLLGIAIHSPSIILLDEPSNHLDAKSRQQLYDFIKSYKGTIIVVSHDRTLLNLLNITYELNRDSIDIYGGNYEFYKAQKAEKLNALQAQLNEKEKELRQALQVAQLASERKQREDSRGKKIQKQGGIPRIAINRLKDQAEGSASKLKETHSEKIGDIADDLNHIRQKLPDSKDLKISFENANLHTGKILITAKDINFGYSSDLLWNNALNFQIRSGDRVAISGSNGIGKTTLLKLVLGKLEPTTGTLVRADFKYLYVDQEYSIIDNRLTVFEQVEQFNSQNFEEHKLKRYLHHFLFSYDTWDKPCSKLSGGEKMKLVFCCLMVSSDTPDMFILDEPTNNLDIQSLEIVTSTIKEYKGTILVISHDQYFIKEIGVDTSINLE